eukprot:403331076
MATITSNAFQSPNDIDFYGSLNQRDNTLSNDNTLKATNLRRTATKSNDRSKVNTRSFNARKPLGRQASAKKDKRSSSFSSVNNQESNERDQFNTRYFQSNNAKISGATNMLAQFRPTSPHSKAPVWARYHIGSLMYDKDKEALYQDVNQQKLLNHEYIKEIRKLRSINQQREKQVGKQDRLIKKMFTSGHLNADDVGDIQDSIMVSELKNQIKNLAKIIEDKDEIIGQMNKDIRVTSLYEARQETQAIQEECQRLRERTEQAIRFSKEVDYERMEFENHNMKQTIQQLEQHYLKIIGDNEQEINNLRNDLKTRDEDILSFQQLLNQGDKGLQIVMKEKVDLNERLNDMQKDLQQMNSDNQALKQEKKELKDKIQELKGQMDIVSGMIPEKPEQTYLQEIQEKNDKIEELEIKIQQKEEMIKHQVTKIKEAAEDNDALREQLDQTDKTKNEENEQKAKQLLEMISKNTELETLVNRLQKDSSTSQNEKEQKINELNNILKAKMKQLLEKDEQYLKLKESLEKKNLTEEEKEQQKSQMHQALIKFEQHTEKMKSQVEELSKLIEELKNQIKEKDQEIERLREITKSGTLSTITTNPPYIVTKKPKHTTDKIFIDNLKEKKPEGEKDITESDQKNMEQASAILESVAGYFKKLAGLSSFTPQGETQQESITGMLNFRVLFGENKIFTYGIKTSTENLLQKDMRYNYNSSKMESFVKEFEVVKYNEFLRILSLIMLKASFDVASKLRVTSLSQIFGDIMCMKEDKRLVRYDIIQMVLENFGIFEDLPPSDHNLRFEPLDLKSKRIMNRLVNYLKSIKLPEDLNGQIKKDNGDKAEEDSQQFDHLDLITFELFKNAITEKEFQRADNGVVEKLHVIDTRLFFKILKSIDVVFTDAVKENLTYFLSVDELHRDSIQVTKLIIAVNDFNQSFSLRTVGICKRKLDSKENYETLEEIQEQVDDVISKHNKNQDKEQQDEPLPQKNQNEVMQ